MPQAHICFTYTFDELDDDSKERAREWYRDGALDYDWWDSVYDNAERIGLTITEFDTYRGHIKGTLNGTVGETVRTIMDEHGRDTDTFKTARGYYYNKHWGHPLDEEEFTRALLEDYLVMLRREYEWLLSDECTDENIRINEYRFDVNGNIA